MLRTLFLAAAVVLGVAAEANGVFMLVAPEDWYFAVPGVTATGPFNQHFLRDIGLIFLLLGGAFLFGAALPRSRVLLWAADSIWLAGHAITVWVTRKDPAFLTVLSRHARHKGALTC